MDLKGSENIPDFRVFAPFKGFDRRVEKVERRSEGERDLGNVSEF
jgi:hypothetical protein